MELFAVIHNLGVIVAIAGGIMATTAPLGAAVNSDKARMGSGEGVRIYCSSPTHTVHPSANMSQEYVVRPAAASLLT